MNVLGPIICSAVAIAEFVPESWLEPIEAFSFFAPGASGFWQNGGRARCTFANLKRMHARETARMVDLNLARTRRHHRRVRTPGHG